MHCLEVDETATGSANLWSDFRLTVADQWPRDLVPGDRD
jgi:hypothetical protein